MPFYGSECLFMAPNAFLWLRMPFYGSECLFMAPNPFLWLRIPFYGLVSPNLDKNQTNRQTKTSKTKKSVKTSIRKRKPSPSHHFHHDHMVCNPKPNDANSKKMRRKNALRGVKHFPLICVFSFTLSISNLFSVKVHYHSNITCY